MMNLELPQTSSLDRAAIQPLPWPAAMRLIALLSLVAWSFVVVIVWSILR